jgi:hypothetical protein
LHKCHDFLDLRGLKQTSDSLGVKIGEGLGNKVFPLDLACLEDEGL